MKNRLVRGILLLGALIVCFDLLASAQIPSLPVRRGELHLNDSEIPSGYRVCGIEIHLAAGRFEAIAEIPPGWHVNIDNESNWKATLEASANLGVRSLSEKDIQNIRIDVAQSEPENEYSNVFGWICVISDTNVTKRVGVSGAGFTFVERYERHRLALK